MALIQNEIAECCDRIASHLLYSWQKVISGSHDWLDERLNCLKDLTSVLVNLSLRSSKSERQIQYLQSEFESISEREKELVKSVKNLQTQVKLDIVVLACRNKEDGAYEEMSVHSLTSQFMETVRRGSVLPVKRRKTAE